MLDNTQHHALDQLAKTLSRDQKLWAAGYLTALAGGAAAAEASGSAPMLHLYYATETGNAKGVAQQLEKAAKARGFRTKSTPLSRVKLEDLANLSDACVLISSTHGEGDPPDMARKFFASLPGDAPALPSLRFAALGLGDSSYAQFCKAAADIEAALTRRGAQPFYPLRLLDVDYAAHIPAWIDGLLDALGPVQGAAPAASAAPEIDPNAPGYSRLHPVTGTIKDIVNLNDTGSNKQTYHIEIAFEADIRYAPGDAAGIMLPATGDAAPSPRLYSIASSQLAYPGEVHLTVSRALHTLPDGTKAYGVCSDYLAQLKPGDHVQFYIQRNARFKLPADERDIIMVGPGTGIAPFRAFMQERAERGASGRSWLFFGEQYAHLDFLYQAEWQEFIGSGALTRIDLAFSRDGKEKHYVQDKIRAQGEELIDWLESGATLYVCGRKEPMSADVEETLLQLLTQKKGSRDEAENMLLLLAEEDRYVKDVY